MCIAWGQGLGVLACEEAEAKRSTPSSTGAQGSYAAAAAAAAVSLASVRTRMKTPTARGEVAKEAKWDSPRYSWRLYRMLSDLYSCSAPASTPLCSAVCAAAISR